MDRNGIIQQENGGQRITIDVERRQQVYDFFVSCGWITAPSSISGEQKKK